MRLVSVLLLLIATQFKACEFYSTCLDIWVKPVQPSECCDYPTDQFEFRARLYCNKHCPESCDYFNCIANHSKIFNKNGDFDVEHGMSTMMVTLETTEAVEKWQETVKTSFDYCVNLIKTKKLPVLMENQGKHMLAIFECVYKQNFIHCPDFKNSDGCKQLKKVLERCQHYIMTERKSHNPNEKIIRENLPINF